MNWTIKLAASARHDISQALNWTLENFGRKKHDQYLELVRLALNDIATNPTGERTKERPELHAEARTLHIGRPGKRARHLFLYRMNTNRSIDVGRFLHDAMELSRHLPEEFEGN